MRRPLLALLAALLLAAPPIAAEEPAPAPPDPETVGRQLLALDPEERAQAEAALLAAVRQGSDPAAYVRRMTAALRDWADREERLIEAWVEAAVHGDSVAQERAVGLLTALGEPAVARLARELRRARLESPAPPTPAEPAAPPPEPVAGVVAGRAQLYDVTDLLSGGSDRLALLSLAKRSADSPDVALLSTRLVVTTTDQGHARLALALEDLRRAPGAAGPVAPAPGARAPEPAATPVAPAAPAPEPAPAPPAPASAAEEGVEPAAGREASDRDAKPAPAPRGPRTKDPPWSLRVWAVSVAEREIDGLLPKQGVGAPERVLRGAGGAWSARGPVEWASGWAQRALRSADAEPLGESTLDLWEQERGAAHLGRVVTYRREARPGASGAWEVVTDTLKTGLEVGAVIERSALELDVAWSSLSQPMQTAAVAPATGVEPVELDRPDWTTSRRREEVEAPAQGVASLLVLPGLLPAPERRLVLVLALQPR